YGTATATGTLTVRRKPVTVTARAAGKVFGDPDPTFQYTTDGIIDGFELTCSVSRPGAGTDESTGTYPNAIVPTGATTQGNYAVTYVPARFSIIPAVPTVQAISYEGVYDGKPHKASALPDVTDDTTVEYRLVGGSDADWSTTPPSITHVGTVEFEVRATNPNYVTAYATGTLTVNRRPVTVSAKPASKSYNTKDPAFSAVVSGTVGKDTISYKVSRPKAGKEEQIGVYTNAIVPTGRETQGDYTVTYIPANFTITQSNVLTINASDYEGLYDARAHKPSATVNITDGTTIEYSTDGKTWSKTVPSITDVGSLRVYVRAVNPKYTTAETTVTLKVNPRPVKVIADDTVKIYGSNDPEFTATVTGLVDDFRINYSVNRQGNDETVGTYRDVLVPTGEQRQGNYIVTYVPADLTIAPNRMVLIADGWDNVYDAESHKPVVSVTVEDGTTIEYSTDGGETWTETPPEIINVGEMTVEVRATNPNYEPVTQTVTLRVTPRPVKVIVNDTTKTSGEDDPDFTATVEGLLGDDTIDYTITRTSKSEKAGTYKESLRASGDEVQGNYVVTYESATLTILPSKAVPASWSFFDIFKPNGSSDKVWALVNLLCLFMMAYLLLPVPHLKDKYGRIKQMRRYNEAIEETEADDERPDSELFEYKVKRFLQRLRIGVAAESVLLIGAVIIFIITENLRNPMVLIDKYTPLMITLLIATWLIDVRLARYRSGLEKEAEEQTDAAQES
ncbi:MAG: hypothetical protein II738_04890, partial [Clostridia bacterium]|nr:hypothetical protein [Clostridia bacterium]